PIGQLEDAVAAEINDARFVFAHDHRRIPVEPVTRRALGWFGPQTPQLAIAQIDPVHFPTLTLGVKRVAVGRVEQHIKTLATGKRDPIRIANLLFALDAARTNP